MSNSQSKNSDYNFADTIIITLDVISICWISSLLKHLAYLNTFTAASGILTVY